MPDEPGSRLGRATDFGEAGCLRAADELGVGLGPALGIALRYQTLREITDDIADARIYGGIHFRFDQDEGAEQGRRVGEYIYRHYLGRCPCDLEGRSHLERE